MEYHILTPGDEWNKLDDELRDIYFTHSYYALNTHLQEGEARCFVYEDRGRKVYYPFVLSGIPGTEHFDIQGAYGYNGVSAGTSDPAIRDGFQKAFSDYCSRSNIVSEFTRFHPLLKNEAFQGGMMEIRPNRKTVLVDLSPDQDDIFIRSYNAANRNKIRKAVKMGISVREAETEKEFLWFGQGCRELMQKLGADNFYLWPAPYFRELYQLEPQKRLLLVGSLDGRDIGGALFLFHGKNSHYHLAARDESRVPLANLLLHEGIRRSKGAGYKRMHLGGGVSGDPQDPLLVFKQNFSPELLDFNIGTRVHNPEVYNTLINDWERENPDRAERMKHYFLRYRLKDSQ